MGLREGIFKGGRFTEKERRNLAIIDIIRRAREVSRAEISRITHLNIVTISNYVDNYILKGLVAEKGLDVSTGGRRPELIELNPRYGYAIGIDLGPPHITDDVYLTGVIVDVHGKVIARVRIKKEDIPQEKLMEKVLDLIQELLDKSKVQKDKVRGIGIGIWGVLDRYKGTVRYAVEQGGVFNYTSLQSMIERRFEIPTLIEHDATAGVLGEKWMGLGLDTESENILYICSDSSCGIILNGELYYGASNTAGELNLNPPLPASGDENCWASYEYGCCMRSRGIDLGIAAAARVYFEKTNGSNSKIIELAKGDLRGITFGAVTEAAKLGDKVAQELLVKAGTYLGAKIAFLINLFNPDSVVIGRGMERAGDLFLEAVRNSAKQWAYEEPLKVVRIILTSLGEDSIACGASALVIQQVFARI